MAEPEYPVLRELETKLKLQWIDTNDYLATQRAIIQVDPEDAYLELPRGRKGDKGDPGPAISMQGIVAADSQLPANAEIGHAYVNTSTKGLAVWNGTSWFKVNNFAGVDADLQQVSQWFAKTEAYHNSAQNSANRAEFAAEETIQQVIGDFATRNYVDAGRDGIEAAATAAAESAQAAKSNATNAVSRVEALESMAGLSPESPVDGQTANLISQQDTLTRSAVLTAVESRVDGRFLPNDTTYALVPRMVYHGTNSKTPRPATDGSVIWLGGPRPVHSQPGDVLLRPAGAEADWTPDWLDLVGWYDPSTLVPGGAVTFVEDLSGHDNHLNIPGGTGTITVNESAMAHPVLSFDGASWIDSGTLSQSQRTYPTTVWIVAFLDEDTGNVMSLFDSANAGKSVVFISNDRNFSAGGGINHFGSDPVPVGTPTLLMVNFAGDSTSHGELNGNNSFGPLDLGSNMSDSHRLGASRGGVNPYAGAIGEVIIASGATAPEREAVTSYLMDKWGIV